MGIDMLKRLPDVNLGDEAKDGKGKDEKLEDANTKTMIAKEIEKDVEETNKALAAKAKGDGKMGEAPVTTPDGEVLMYMTKEGKSIEPSQLSVISKNKEGEKEKDGKGKDDGKEKDLA